MDYQPNNQLLLNKNILVTGAGDGIGSAAAKSYAAHGATVILLGKTTTKLEKVYDEIEALNNPKPFIFPMDLNNTHEPDHHILASAIRDQIGSLHGLLHNAGVLGQRTPIGNYHEDIWRQVLEVNLTAPFMLTKALLPLMEQAADASIIFTSSGVGRKSRAFWGAYAVSKFATEGLMQTLADELHGISNIRVNCINPGATRTSMRSRAYPAEDIRQNPLPAKIMASYLYLMGPDSQHINGQSLNAQ